MQVHPDKCHLPKADQASAVLHTSSPEQTAALLYCLQASIMSLLCAARRGHVKS